MILMKKPKMITGMTPATPKTTEPISVVLMGSVVSSSKATMKIMLTESK